LIFAIMSCNVLFLIRRTFNIAKEESKDILCNINTFISFHSKALNLLVKILYHHCKFCITIEIITKSIDLFLLSFSINAFDYCFRIVNPFSKGISLIISFSNVIIKTCFKIRSFFFWFIIICFNVWCDWLYINFWSITYFIFVARTFNSILEWNK
jgi:hypothetical protein